MLKIVYEIHAVSLMYLAFDEAFCNVMFTYENEI